MKIQIIRKKICGTTRTLFAKTSLEVLLVAATGRRTLSEEDCALFKALGAELEEVKK